MRPTSPAATIAILWLVSTAYSIFWLTHGSFDLLRPEADNGLLFNNMLAHMLSGRFDVDPAAITYEAFIRDGRTYSYYGVFCAALRLPLLLTGGLDHSDVTSLSMAAAVSLNWLGRLLALFTIYRRTTRSSAARSVFAIVLLAMMLSGESIQFLSPSIYQEVICWAGALASGFVLLLIRFLLVPETRRAWLFSGMALLAGLALLTRPTTGLGLYAALGLILCVAFARAAQGWRAAGDALRSPDLLAPVAILTACVIIFGVVNFERWGNPLTGVDYHLYAKSHTVYLDQVPRLDRYGEFNLARVPFGLQYYFAPLWIFRGGDGRLLWADHMLRLLDGADLPPGSFFLTDPVTCLLAGFFLFRAIRGRAAFLCDMRVAIASLAGLAVPPLLLLGFIYFSHRYRAEFYPFFDTAAFLGLALLLRETPHRLQRWRQGLGIAGIVGVVGAHAALFAYLLSPIGPTNDLDMSHGLRGVYRAMTEGRSPYADHHAMPPPGSPGEPPR